MTRFLPVILTAVAITGVAIFNGFTTNRWSGGINAKAEACAAYLEFVPTEVGPWVGEQNDDVDERIRDVAGVVGEPISRRYRHRDTGEVVDLWLIVGHSSLIVRHTPNICYKTAGFRPEEEDHHYKIPVEGEQPMTSWTNLFYRQTPDGQAIQLRVFWMWYKPQPGAPVQWDAPGHEVNDARDVYAGSKALFKMYFTTPARSPDELPDESAATKFAQDFVPELNALLANAAEGKAPPTVAASEDADGAGEAAADAA
ncbi:MAG: exosortase-associated EpsI family protein [Planctomycetota bacterium]